MSVFQRRGYFQFCTLSKKTKQNNKTTKTVHSTSIQTHYSFTLNLCLLPSLKVMYIGTVIKFMNHVWSTPFLIVIHNSALTQGQS